MDNKVILIYDNGEYMVCINGIEIIKDKDDDVAFEKFKNVVSVVKENIPINNNWESVSETVKELNVSEAVVNEEHQTIVFEELKYFYKTNKVFYMNNGEMVQLTGGQYLLPNVLKIVKDGEIENPSEFIKFLKDIIEAKATYRVNDGAIVVGSAAFNYGSAEYIFSARRINKGASVEKGSFEVFKNYVYGIINK